MRISRNKVKSVTLFMFWANCSLSHSLRHFSATYPSPHSYYPTRKCSPAQQAQSLLSMTGATGRRTLEGTCDTTDWRNIKKAISLFMLPRGQYFSKA